MHGFFVGMGGLAIHIPKNLPESENCLAVDINETWFVNGGGISSLINQEPNHNGLKRLSEDEIKSKSKASGLAKTLVCIQALWFISQCLTRRMC